jgi:hypothetical protein
MGLAQLSRPIAILRENRDASRVPAPLLDLGEVVDIPILPGSILNSSKINKE